MRALECWLFSGTELLARIYSKEKVSIYVCLTNRQYDIYHCLTLYTSLVILSGYVCNDFIINSIIVLPYRPIFENARGARDRVCHMVILS